MATLEETLKKSTELAQKAAGDIGGTFKQGVGFTPGPIAVDTFDVPEIPMTPVTPETEIVPDIAALPVALEPEPETTPQLSPQEQAISETVKRATELTGVSAEEEARRAELEAAPELEAKRLVLSDLFGEFETIKAEAAQLKEQERLIPIKVQQEAAAGTGIRTRQDITQETRGKLRDLSIRQGIVTSKGLMAAASISAAQGKLSTALDMVDRAVKAEFAPRKAELQTALQNIELLRQDPALSRADEKRADERKLDLTRKLNEIETEAEEKKNIGGVASRVASQGADAMVLREINQAESEAEAISIAASAGFGEPVEVPDFKFVPQTKTQQGGVFDPSTGTFIPLGVTPGTIAEGVLTNAQKRSLEQADTAIVNIDNVLKTMETGISKNAMARVLQSKIPGTRSFDLDKSMDTIKALIGFDALEKMRLASPTGGALGAISERELSYLQSVAGSLDIGQSTETLKTNLNRIRESFSKVEFIIEAKGEGWSDKQIQDFLSK